MTAARMSLRGWRRFYGPGASFLSGGQGGGGDAGCRLWVLSAQPSFGDVQLAEDLGRRSCRE